MQKSKVAIQVINPGLLPDDTVMLGEMYMKQWKIPEGQPVVLKFGAFRQPVKVVPVARYDGMRISQQLARRMGIPAGASLRILYRPVSSTLSLGPLIGVLISRDYPGMPDRPFGAITQFCKELVEACRLQGAMAYFFTPDQIGESANYIEGWVCPAGKWFRQTMPVADVINNRLTTRKLENRSSVQRFMKETKARHQTHFFNEKFLDKTEVFDSLKQDLSLTRYLPESHLLGSYSTLKAMCSRYPVVFLKPIRGSLGKGIMRISRTEGGGLLALSTTAGGTRKQQYANAQKLFSAISGKMKTVRYQIQQGLQLIDIQKRPVDFRALVQKNSKGKWTITSIVGRIAGNHHFVSNLARGGTLTTVKGAIARSNLAPGTSRQEAAGRLQRAALEIAAGIDAHIPAHFGELGIDLALDTSGRVWLLEVNSKPSKNDNTPLNDNKIRPSVRKLIQYARYLCGY